MYDYFRHVAFAQAYPEAAELSADQFELWWRSLTPEEREKEDSLAEEIRHRAPARP